MPNPAGLTAAAQALEAELDRFDQLTTALQREALNSEKGIKRAAQHLEQLAECDSRLAERVQTLVGAVSSARSRQETQASAVQQYASNVQHRAAVLAGLNAQGELLNDTVAKVNQHAQQILAAGGNGQRESLDLRGPLAELRTAVQALAERAQGLADSAQGEGFADIARHAHSLRDQLLATHNKLVLLEQQKS